MEENKMVTITDEKIGVKVLKKREMAHFITEQLYPENKITEDHWHVEMLMKRKKHELEDLYKIAVKCYKNRLEVLDIRI
jgi:hypothetical protein